MSKIILKNFLRQKIRIVGIDPKGREYIIPEMKSLSASGESYVDRVHFRAHNKLRIYTIRPLMLYADVCIGDKPLEQFNVGMVTSKRVPNFISHNIAPNATSGRDFIRIHNLSKQYLNLNQGFTDGIDVNAIPRDNIGSIVLPPGGVTEFSGWTRLGMQLGSVLKDVNGRYPDFVWDIPSTDVYYGVNSEIEFPKFSGSQYSFYFLNSMSPDYLFEQGLIGGIDYTTNRLGPLKDGYRQW